MRKRPEGKSRERKPRDAKSENPKTDERNDQRITIYLPDGAVAGRVVAFRQTGLVAQVERQVPDEGRFRFTLHLPGIVVAGEVARISQEERICRLQFVALSPADRAHLGPWIEPEE